MTFKSFIFTTLMLAYNYLSAQTVNDVPLKDIDVDYVQIIGTPKLLGNKLTIQIDFGQENKLFKARDTQLKDSTGKTLTLNSMIDALNFMSKNGYEFVFAYATQVAINSNTFTNYYLLKRKTNLPKL
jgi:hypothetical protein